MQTTAPPKHVAPFTLQMRSAPSLMMGSKRISRMASITAVVFALFLPMCVGQGLSTHPLYVREEGSFGGFVGFGVVNGLHVGFQYYNSNRSSIEISYGVVPLLSLSGRKATIIAGGINTFLNPERNVSPVISLLLSVCTVRSTMDAPLGNIYFASPALGLDGSWHTFTIRARIGPALGILSPGNSRIGIHVDAGVGWTI